MTDDVLVMPRRLAIEILHAAQQAQPEAIRGVVAARDGQPVSFHPDGTTLPAGVQRWARLWSHPQSAAIPGVEELADGGLSLVVSLNTKGVLEMRAWRLDGDRAAEQVLKVRD
ncbi:hypothetical protein AAG565_13960 [Fontimonas sp. SYSU GA230001]|uniref:hypothetical protein n=1 Tax=Fontimonas sp. SYSU GA230001 TaxID=3142450 RepID=UPI0032B39858